MLPGAVSLNVIGGDHEIFRIHPFMTVNLPLPLPLVDGGISALLSKRNLVRGLADGAGDLIFPDFVQVKMRGIPVSDGQ